MPNLTSRQVIQAGATAGLTLCAVTLHADCQQRNSEAFNDRFLPKQITEADIRAGNDASFTKLTFAGTSFWVRTVNLGYGVPHTLIGIYAPDQDGKFHRALSAESWAAGNIEAKVDAATGILELRERANSKLKGEIVLSCNLKTIGTYFSAEGK